MFKIAIASTAFALTAMVAAPAEAAPCKSTWQGLTSNLKTFNATIAKGVCKQLAKSDGKIDEAKAQKCIDDYEKAKAEAEKYAKMYNDTNTGSGKIGPRGMAHDRTYYGGLMTERLFIGREILSDEYTVRFEGDGGKKKKDYTVTVCFVDDNGEQVVDPYVKTFKTNDGKFVKTFSKVAGARPMVYLRSSHWVSTNKNKYKFRGEQGDVPRTVRAAMAVASETGSDGPSVSKGKSASKGKSNKKGKKGKQSKKSKKSKKGNR